MAPHGRAGLAPEVYLQNKYSAVSCRAMLQHVCNKSTLASSYRTAHTAQEGCRQACFTLHNTPRKNILAWPHCQPLSPTTTVLLHPPIMPIGFNAYHPPSTDELWQHADDQSSATQPGPCVHAMLPCWCTVSAAVQHAWEPMALMLCNRFSQRT
jgi:hypothetical protein